MSFWKNFKKILGVGWKVTKLFYTPPKIIEIIADAVLRVEKEKNTSLKNLRPLELNDVALSYALNNPELYDWVKTEVNDTNINKMKGYLLPVVKEFYKNNKEKIRKKIK